MATYYVRKTGNNGNSGTTGSPWLTIQFGADQLSAGDILIVGAGTYNESVTVTEGGSASGTGWGGNYVTIQSETLHAAIVTGSGTWRFNVEANFVKIDGFALVAGSGARGGVQCNEGWHHIYVLNNDIAPAEFHGIASGKDEYLWFEGNYIHGGRFNSWWSAISVYQAQEIAGDTTYTGYRIVIRNNRIIDNTQPGGSEVTDGNGIIIDDFYNGQDGGNDIIYPYPTLVEQNVCARNGLKGIQVFVSAHVMVRNNTCAFNSLEGSYGWRGEIAISDSTYCTVVNNIAVCDSSVGPAADGAAWEQNYAMMCRGGAGTGNVFHSNICWDIGGTNTFIEETSTNPTVTNQIDEDPDFVNVATDDYRVQSGSPAINAGTNVHSLATTDILGNARVFGAAVDVGAYEYNSASEDNGMVIDEDAVFYLGSAQKYKIYFGSTLLVDQTPDSTAPTLSSPTDTANGSTAATGTVSTNEGNGTLYWVASTSGTAPTATQVKAGQMHTGAAAAASGSQAVSGTGVQTLSPAPSGLTASTAYTLHYMHEDAATNKSSVSSADGFTTSAGGAVPVLESQSNTTFASRTNTTITAPTGIATGNVLVMAFVTESVGTAPTPTFPAGWTEIGSVITGSDEGFEMGVRCAIKVASGESGDYTVNHTTCSAQGWIGRFSGVNTTTPQDATSTGNTGDATGSAATRTWTGLTTVTNNVLLLAIGWDWDSSAGLSPPSGMTERLDTTVTYVATETRATAGATGNRTHTSSTSTDGGPWFARLIALRPA